VYLDDLAARIRTHIPADRLPDADSDTLLRLSAALLRAKGTRVTQSDVHDAWSAWIADRNPDHVSLRAYDDLPEDVRAEDAVFTTAIRRAAEQVNRTEPSRPQLTEVLFPSGPPRSDDAVKQALELYKIMVGSSEGLVSRRQAVNTFFLTMNGALLTASGLIVQNSTGSRWGALGVSVLSVAGAILCLAWRSLITSFGQLNRGKFVVINTIERYLSAAIYAAEWEALGRGDDPKVYRSFTSREIWVPNALLALHLLATIAAIAVVMGWVTLNVLNAPPPPS
jgi:hypothetical protein